MNEHIKKVWQPGDLAMLCDYQGKPLYPVAIIRYSKLSPAYLFVERIDNGKQLTAHKSMLAEAPESPCPQS